MRPISSMLTLVAKFIVVTTALWLGLIGLATTYAAKSPMHDMRVSYFGQCNGDPCIMGLIPGISSWQEAQHTLAGYQGEFSDKQIIIPLSPPSEIAFYPSIDETSVGRVQVAFKTPLSLGWILAQFGRPCGITIYTNVGLLTMRYTYLLANVRLQTPHLRSDMPVTGIQFSDPNYESKMQPNICVDNITDGARNRSWKGFAPIWSYLSHVN